MKPSSEKELERNISSAKNLKLASTEASIWKTMNGLQETVLRYLRYLKATIAELEVKNTERVTGLKLKGKFDGEQDEPMCDGSELCFAGDCFSQLESQIEILKSQSGTAQLKKKKIGCLQKAKIRKRCTPKFESISPEEYQCFKTKLEKAGPIVAGIDQYCKILESSHRMKFLSSEELGELEKIKEDTRKNKGYIRFLERIVKNEKRLPLRKAISKDRLPEVTIQEKVNELQIDRNDRSLSNEHEESIRCESEASLTSATDSFVSDISCKLFTKSRPSKSIQRDHFMEEKMLRNVKFIGSGSRGIVYLVDDDTFGLCAVKKINVSLQRGRFGYSIGGSSSCFSNDRDSGFFDKRGILEEDVPNNQGSANLKRETELYSEVSNHPNIVSFYGILEADKAKTRIYTGLVMEYMAGGSLAEMCACTCENVFTIPTITFSLITADPSYLTEIRVVNYSLDIARALAFSHTKLNIIHGDVKPSNVLLTSDKRTAKLGDFGCALRDEHLCKTTQRQEIQFMAPELINENILYLKYGFKVDVWSYAMFVYAIAFKRDPFDECDLRSSCSHRDKLMSNERPPTTEWPMREEGLKEVILDVIRSGWKTLPEERREMTETVEILTKIMSKIPTFDQTTHFLK